MSSARALAIARIVFACVVAFGIALTPPDLERLFASFARARPNGTSTDLGWLGHALVNAGYASPWHYGAIVAGSVLAALFTLAFVERRALRTTSPLGTFIAVIFVALGSLDAFHAGGGVSTFAFAALALLLLERPSLASSIGLAALTIVWCNFEAAGLLAPALALVSASARTFARDARELRGFAWLGFALAAAATLIGPLGIDFPGHALAALQLAGAADEYALWSPADVEPHGYRIGVMALVLAALAVGLRGRTLREGALALFAFVVSLANGAFVPLFGIVVAPIVAANFFGRRSREDVAAPAQPWRAASVTFVASLLVAAVAGSVVGTRALPISDEEPYAALARLARDGGVHRVFCANAAWCDGARAVGLAVVADSGIANASSATRDAYVRILRTRKTWRGDLDRLDVDTAVVRSNSALATLLADTRWNTYAITGKIAIFRRITSRP